MGLGSPLTKKQMIFIIPLILILGAISQPEVRGDLVDYYKKAHRKAFTSTNGAAVNFIEESIKLVEFRLTSRSPEKKNVAEIVLQDLKTLKHEAESRSLSNNSDSRISDVDYYTNVAERLAFLAMNTETEENLTKWKEAFSNRNNVTQQPKAE